MELTEQQQHDVAYDIAADNPRILLNALRANGFYIYAISKEDLQNEFMERTVFAHKNITLPITNEDMNDLNGRVSIDDIFSDRYKDMVDSMLNQIDINRFEEDNK